MHACRKLTLHLFARGPMDLWKWLKRKGGIWSGRRDLNPGPLAPQAKNINHLQTASTENKRLEAARFGRQMDAKTPISLFGLHTDSTIW